MNIVLINPPAHRRVEEYDLATWQHLGIGRLSSYVKQFGHKVTLIDAKLQQLTIAQVLKMVEEKNPDVVGLTAMTPDIYNAYALARGTKGIDKKIITVIGGCHATAMPELTLREEASFDYLVAGEGERTFEKLLDGVASGASTETLREIRGIVFREGAEIIKTQTQPWDIHIEELPIPDWQLHPYATHYKLETSRGCPFKCNFCMRVLGEEVRYFPVENVLGEFEHIMRMKDNLSMEIVDENFTLNPKRINQFLDGMIGLGVSRKIRWFCSTRANLVTKELLKKMKRAGCYRVVFGVESGNKRVLKRMRKKVELEDVSKAVRLTRETGIESFLGFIFGHPDEKLEEMTDTVNFAVRANPDIAALGTMVPYPGTEIAQIVERGEGNYRLLSRDWTEYNRQFSYVLELNDVSKRDMDKLQLLGTLKLYVFNGRILDLIKFLWGYRRETLQFFKMFFSAKTEKGESISRSRISFLQLVRIFLSPMQRKGENAK